MKAWIRRDLVLLLLLLTLAAGLRTWQISHTEAVARDCVCYIRYARQLEHHPCKDVIVGGVHHPGYPLCVLGMSFPVRHFYDGPDWLAMQFSAQLVNALASTLLVIPMFYLGRVLFNRSVGFWACVWYQCLPSSSRYLADGLSEGTFLLFAVTGLLMGVWGLRLGRRQDDKMTSPSPQPLSPAAGERGWGEGDDKMTGNESVTLSPCHPVTLSSCLLVCCWALCGLFGGLAYLTRPEGALIVGAFGLVLLVAQFMPSQRRPWGNFLAGMASLGCAALAVGGPFVAITGAVTTKPSGGAILKHLLPVIPDKQPDKMTMEDGGSRMEDRGSEIEDRTDACPSSILHPPSSILRPVTLSPCHPVTLSASTLAIWLPEQKSNAGSRYRILWGLWAVALELAKGYGYVAWLPMIVGFWWYRDRLRASLGVWAMLTLCLILSLVLWRVAAKLSYMSDRYTLLLVLCGIFWAVAGLFVLGDRLKGMARSLLPGFVVNSSKPILGVLFVVVIAGVALPKTFEPLHSNQVGFRAAGLWLQQNAKSWDKVDDSNQLANFYAGREQLEGPLPPPPPGCQPAHYFVFSPGNERFQKTPYRGGMPFPNVTEKDVKFRWANRRGKDGCDVLVYLVPPSPAP